MFRVDFYVETSETPGILRYARACLKNICIFVKELFNIVTDLQHNVLTMELQIIQSKIYQIRGLRVILDKDIAKMYEVTTGNLNKAVKRNADRFPEDFMFQLTNEEFDLIFQNGTSSWGGTRKLPYAFTEHGVAMLAGLLNSEKAIEVNIQIVRAFVTLRQYALGYAELNQKLEAFMIETNMQFSDIYQALTEMASQNEKENKLLNPVGFLTYNKD